MPTANYFYTCHLHTENYVCNESVPIGCQNATRLACINPVNSARSYQYLDVPIPYISLEDLDLLYASGRTAIVGVIILAIYIGLTLTLSFAHFPLILLYIPLALFYISDVFLVVSLVTDSFVIRYHHVGCGLFVTSIMIVFLFKIIGTFTVRPLEAIRTSKTHIEQRT
jgi:hypothetical protein